MIIKLPVLGIVLLGVAACSGAPAYVDKPYEINRENADFPEGPPIVHGSQVTICYKKSGTTPAQIRALAEEECARGNLNATFTEQTYSLCPLLTPTAAVFSCTETVAGGRRTTTGAGAAATAAPLFEAPRPAGLGRSFGAIGAADVSTTAKSQPFPKYLFNSPQPER
ncbi:MAG: hypothetical protein JJ900_08700 [Rhodospirillales bacterium]|nr:hypothetical protein [Rhodospirillales bacterium]MBO6786917.1 hypothetical protein [Rhodospirillales bacterium]